MLGQEKDELAMKFNFLVFPYRDLYFRYQYGPAVRDLQILDALVASNRVESVTVINRPVSIYERALGKKHRQSKSYTAKLRSIDTTSSDLVGPLSKRKWLDKCYNNQNIEWRIQGRINVVLDFIPFGKIDYKRLDPDFIWYDLIDNFTKHNRFDTTEKEMVRAKYAHVSKIADLVTGVSKAAVAAFENGKVVSNAAGISSEETIFFDDVDAQFDFGFIGFITDKLDLRAIKSLSDAGYKVLLAGQSFSDETIQIAKKMPNVTISGPFQHRDIPALLARIKIGLIPYLKDKLHDESPLKLYQYLKHGKPVLTSQPFELISEFIIQYSDDKSASIIEPARKSIEIFNQQNRRQRAMAVIGPEHFWEYKLETILQDIKAQYFGGLDE